VKDFKKKSSDDKKKHYNLIKEYFENEKDLKKEKFQGNKISHKQQKIYNLTFSILNDILKNRPEYIRIVDVGCGTGIITAKLSNFFPQLKRIVAIDFLKPSKFFSLISLKNSKLSFIQANLLNIPFSKRSFDITICLFLLYYIHRDYFKNSIILL